MSPDLRTDKQLIAEILERVRDLAALRAATSEFVPGKSFVRYGGRVYDEKEMMQLVESSLEFWLTAGRWHHKFETRLAEWFGARHARLVNSGSSANLLAVAALTSPSLCDRRLRAGDEVITIAAGFPTTVAPLIQHRLVPVFVDVVQPTCNIDVSKLKAALTPRTRAIVVAHTLGNPFDLGSIVAFCRAHDLWLVEDTCDAAGATYGGRRVGSFGDLATLSFYPAHHMTTGEGGAVLVNDEALLRPVESFRDWGKDCWCIPGVDNTCRRRFGWQLGDLPFGYDHKYVFSHLGYNLKMTDMQAAVGCAQLDKLAAFVERRIDNWNFYRDALSRAEKFMILPDATPGSEPSWFGFLMTVRDDAPFTRDEVVRYLESRRIQTRMLFAGNLARQPALTTLAEEARRSGTDPPFRISGELATTDQIMRHAFWIGVYPGLTNEMRRFVADEILAFCATHTV